MLGVFFVLVVSLLVWWGWASGAPTNNSSAVGFVIPKGASASRIAGLLADEGLIRSEFAFRVYTQVFGKSSKIYAGEHNLAKNLSLPELVGKLFEPPSQVWVTIPEGLRLEQVAQRVIDGLELEGVVADKFYSDFLKLTEGKEGYLFPDTYLFAREVSVENVVSVMENTFEKKVGEVSRRDVIIASLVEKETKTEEERPIVAGIIIKRLEAGWALNIDATVQYAIASDQCLVVGGRCEWWPRITRDDYEYNSAYNTYKFAGLPPAPIANPGLASVEAVRNYEESPYWYYLHTPDGDVVFSETLEEHNSNVDKYLR